MHGRSRAFTGDYQFKVPYSYPSVFRFDLKSGSEHGRLMKRLLLSLLSLLILCDSLAHAAKKPNVVLVITDDQGYNDVAAHGNPYLKTPNLDRLHEESVRLEDYHVAPTCAPTRAALMTGHWTNRTGVWHTIMGRSMIRSNEITMGDVFGAAGYATGMFGKWHLGDNYPYRPEDRGFQEVLRHGGGGVGQTPDYWDNAYFDGSYWHNSKVTPAKGHCTDVFFDYATKFIDRSAGKETPFFAYISTNAPHSPYHAPQEFADMYPDLKEKEAHYYGMITHIDEAVGRLRAHLKDAGLEKDTIFIFTTDNGSTATKLFDAGMRGGKGSQYDGGHRVPFFVHWPGGKMVGGKEVDTITSYVDILPTLIDLCKIPAPQGVEFDGVSIAPLLRKGDHEGWKHSDRLLVTDSQRVRDPIKWRQSAVMSERWRLIDGRELYDIDADGDQKNDVAAQHPEVMQRMTEFYEDWWAELEPTFAQTTEIYLGHPDANPVDLTCHDWIADELTPWNQAHVRNGEDRPGYQGYWAVKIVEDGEYEIELRRWPKEADAALGAFLPAGEAVPGLGAFRTRPGKPLDIVKARLEIAGQKLEKKVDASADKGATFKLTLKKGVAELWTKFDLADGGEVGAYYAYVRKL